MNKTEPNPSSGEINIKVNDTKLKVVGYYESSEYTNMLSNLNTIKYKLLDTSKNITVYPKDKEEALDYFSNNLNIMDIYEKDKEEYKKGISIDKENIKTEKDGYASSVNKVFACGDMRRGQSLVVWAIKEGRGAAKEVDKFLCGYTNLE